MLAFFFSTYPYVALSTWDSQADERSSIWQVWGTELKLELTDSEVGPFISLMYVCMYGHTCWRAEASQF